MRILVVGSGGREHSLCWKIRQSPLVTALLCAPGNAGIADLAECVAVAAEDVSGLVALATERDIDLVVVGPEAPLVAGLVDQLTAAGIAAFGPTAKAAILGLMWSTANALGRQGITTNCVMPNASTRMSDSYYGKVEWLSDQVGETLRSDLAEGTYRDPALMAPLVGYLLSDAARAINGQVFQAKGYEIQHLGRTNWDKAMTNTGPWDIASIAERLPQELGPNLRPRPMPWPEKAP